MKWIAVIVLVAACAIAAVCALLYQPWPPSLALAAIAVMGIAPLAIQWCGPKERRVRRALGALALSAAGFAIIVVSTLFLILANFD